jgi:hypothetical protein
VGCGLWGVVWVFCGGFSFLEGVCVGAVYASYLHLKWVVAFWLCVVLTVCSCLLRVSFMAVQVVHMGYVFRVECLYGLSGFLGTHFL